MRDFLTFELLDLSISQFLDCVDSLDLEISRLGDFSSARFLVSDSLLLCSLVIFRICGLVDLRRAKLARIPATVLDLIF